MPRINIDNFYGGLSLIEPSNIEDNQFEILTNFFYNSDKRLQTRRGMTTFGNPIGSSPITSYFFFQRDDTLARMALCTSGTQMYKYNETTSNWDSIKTGLSEFEADGTTRTKWSFCVYKNVVYMCNGVDCYASYDGTTYTELGVSSVGAATFDNTTDIITVGTHGLAENDTVKFTGGTIPTGITEGKYYYVKYIDANTFRISLTPSGTKVNFTTNGAATVTCSKTVQPLVRYLQYMGDRVMGAGDDSTPSTLYYTASYPADATTLLTNLLVVGGDELGRINGLKELGALILVQKSKKWYSVSLSGGTCTAIDSQNGGYSHRAIQNIENAIIYYSDAGIDTLKQRTGATGAAALTTESKSSDLNKLLGEITPKQYNQNIGYFNKAVDNYYFTFDTGNDSVPDTTLVYSSLVGKWTQYNLPSIYDYGFYIDSDGVYHYLVASASGGQMYEIETGFQDFGAAISTELKTKKWDFKDASLLKTYDTVDIIGLKNEGSEINIDILVDGDIICSAILDDTFINYTASVITIGTKSIGTLSIGGGSGSGSDIDLFQYIIRVPMYSSGSNIQIRMYSDSNPNVWTLEKIRINYLQESLDLFHYNNIS